MQQETLMSDARECGLEVIDGVVAWFSGGAYGGKWARLTSAPLLIALPGGFYRRGKRVLPVSGAEWGEAIVYVWRGADG